MVKNNQRAAASRRKYIEHKAFWKLKEIQILAYNSYEKFSYGRISFLQF